MSQLYTDFLAPYIPQSALAMVAEQLAKYKVRVVITNPRKSKHGDYRAHHRGHRHQISINGNLNSYAFLETLLHEYAHLLVNEQYGRRVQSHGIEWQDMYRQVLQPYLAANVFPADVAAVIQHHTQKTTIGACNSPEMTKVFKQYDPPPKQGEQALSVALETLPYYTCFKNKDGKVFVKCQLKRTKYICIELTTGYVWTFNALADVIPIAPDKQTQDMLDVLTALQTPNSNNRFVKLGSINVNGYCKSLDGIPKQVINKIGEKVTYKNLINHQLYMQHQLTLVVPVYNSQ